MFHREAEVRAPAVILPLGKRQLSLTTLTAFDTVPQSVPQRGHKLRLLCCSRNQPALVGARSARPHLSPLLLSFAVVGNAFYAFRCEAAYCPPFFSYYSRALSGN